MFACILSHYPRYLRHRYFWYMFSKNTTFAKYWNLGYFKLELELIRFKLWFKCTDHVDLSPTTTCHVRAVCKQTNQFIRLFYAGITPMAQLPESLNMERRSLTFSKKHQLTARWRIILNKSRVTYLLNYSSSESWCDRAYQ